jgi:hypothetical protein
MQHKRFGLLMMAIITVVAMQAGMAGGHEWVDLGLSVKWATCNVGATSAGETGGHYVFGGLKNKEVITEISDDLADLVSELGGGTISLSKFDVANSNWGGHWRMPTLDELGELKEKCDIEETSIGGVRGVKFTGPNGNSIFLPVTNNNGNKGYYWTDKFDDDKSDADYAYALQLDLAKGGVTIDARKMINWSCVRPVYDPTAIGDNDNGNTQEDEPEVQQPQENSGVAPSATISRIDIENRINYNGMLGFNLQVDFQAENMAGKKGMVCAYFYDEGFQPLEDKDNLYCTTDGKVSTNKPFTMAKNSHSGSIKVFFPYSQLHLDGGTHTINVKVQIYCNGHFISENKDQIFTVQL